MLQHLTYLIIIYNERNLQDDLGQKKVVFGRRTKYPERICNFTKCVTSIMIWYRTTVNKSLDGQDIFF